MLETRIQQHFIDSADLKYQSAQTLAQPLAAAVQAVLACITSGGKALACGAGPSAALAQQFAALCVEGFERDRPALPALALQPHEAERQIHALGQAGDVLLALSPSGDDACVLAAAQAAHERDMTVLAFTGRSGGALAALLRETDVLLAVPHERAARVREVHMLALHCLCDGMDTQLLGEQELS